MDDELVIQGPELCCEDDNDNLKTTSVAQALLSPPLPPASNIIVDKGRVWEHVRSASPPSRSITQPKLSNCDFIIESPAEDISRPMDSSSAGLFMPAPSYSPYPEGIPVDLRESNHLFIQPPLETDDSISPELSQSTAAMAMETFFPEGSSLVSDGTDSTLTILPPEDLCDCSEPMDIDGDRSLEELFSSPPRSEASSQSDRIHIVIDGANLGWSHGEGHRFSAQGIKVAVEHLELRYRDSVSVTVFLPAQYVQSRPKDRSRGNALMETDDWEILNDLRSRRTLACVPPSGNDDLYAITYAHNVNGFIISNDFFTDHVQSISSFTARVAFQRWLQERRCAYVFPTFSTFMLDPDCYLYRILEGGITDVSNPVHDLPPALSLCTCNTIELPPSFRPRVGAAAGGRDHPESLEVAAAMANVRRAHLDSSRFFMERGDCDSALQRLHCLLAMNPRDEEIAQLALQCHHLKRS